MISKPKKIFMALLALGSLMGLTTHHLWAKAFDVGGAPLLVQGYAQQTLQYGIGGDGYDTQEDFQAGLFQGLIEMTYSPGQRWRFFGSAKLNLDWAYQVIGDNDDWEDKNFQGSRRRLNFFNDGRDIIGELYINYDAGDLNVRLGKQIIAWGQTDGFRLMDQINPTDTRRGMGDVQFETSIIPLWLMRLDYYLPIESESFLETSLQLVFNPNLEFRGNENPLPGNDYSGIWSPNVQVPFGGPFPMDHGTLGSFDADIKEYDNAFENEGMEFGVRLRSSLSDGSLITLNYFYGRDNDFVQTLIGPPRLETNQWDGRQIVHLPTIGYYPRFHILGGTYTRDLDFIRITSIGGVAPVLRLEAFYGFDNTFGAEDNTIRESDELRFAIGLDWKIKLPWLNRTSLISISPQFYDRRIMDNSPDGTHLNDATGTRLSKDNYQTTLMLTTNYYNTKIKPLFFIMRDITNEANMIKCQVTYDHSDRWRYTLGSLFFNGNDKGRGLEVFSHKDHLFITAAYKF